MFLFNKLREKRRSSSHADLEESSFERLVDETDKHRSPSTGSKAEAGFSLPGTAHSADSDASSSSSSSSTSSSSTSPRNSSEPSPHHRPKISLAALHHRASGGKASTLTPVTGPNPLSTPPPSPQPSQHSPTNVHPHVHPHPLSSPPSPPTPAAVPSPPPPPPVVRLPPQASQPSSPRNNKPGATCPICFSVFPNLDEYEMSLHVESCLRGQAPSVSSPRTRPTSSRSSSSYTPQPTPSYTPSTSSYSASDASSSPFAINCPYDNCYARLEAYDFPTHVVQKHTNVRQNYACPVCFLSTGQRFTVNENTNLLSHIQRVHADMLMSNNSSSSDDSLLAAALAASSMDASSSSGSNSRNGMKRPHPGASQQPSSSQPSSNNIFYYNPSSQYPGNAPQPAHNPHPAPSHTRAPQTNTAPPAASARRSTGSSAPVVAAPAPAPALQYIEDIIHEYRAGVECMICLEEFKVGDDSARLECLCLFHKTCIDAWLHKGKKCPLHSDDPKPSEE